MQTYLIGIDAGTTKIKAVLFDPRGNQIADSAVENHVLIPHPTWSEQSMEDLWNCVCEAVRTLVGKTGVTPAEITAIGLSAQGEGLWTLDKDGKPTGTAFLWNDGRAAELVQSLKADPVYNEIKLRLGTFVKPGSTLVQIKWLAENDPERFRRVKTIFTCKDYIRYCMTGQIAWERTDASCSCLDLKTLEYPKDLFRKLGIADALDKLPPLIGAVDRGGVLTEDAAEKLGLTAGIPVSGGMIDVIATAIGAGAVETYSVSSTLGTTGMNMMTVESYEPDLVFNGWECHMLPGKYVKGMGMMAAMPNQDWLLKEVFGEEKITQELFEKTDSAMLAMEPGQGGLLYLPHIAESGERAPFFNPNAAAQLMGIKTTTTRNEILHAVIEGVCMGFRSCLEGIPNSQPVLLSGGGAKSRVWPKFFADCTGRDVILLDATELAARGAAISAALMVGLCEQEELKDFCRARQKIQPDPVKVRKYDKIYEMYRTAQQQAETFWRWRADFLKGE
ncbi:carbohydrate kinase [bacterium]|nr:carbohydrate kinase [bacterium]